MAARSSHIRDRHITDVTLLPLVSAT